MNKVLRRWSPFSALVVTNAALGLCYLGLVAFSMIYAALEVEFSQSVKNDEASVATLDASYLAALQGITTSNYASNGYAAPIAKIFVPSASPSLTIR